MSDISMCTGKGCDRKGKCHRYTAPINEHYQSYMDFDPKDCDDFWDNEGYHKGKHICNDI